MFKFYTTLTFEQSIDHRHSDWSVDNIYSYRCWYEEDIKGKDTLLIQVGDSWTWGDHLGIIDWNQASNDPCRQQQIVGRKLSDLLDADWVNLARPGCSNYWMLEKLQDLRPFIEQSAYKKIYVVVTLTEDLREAEYTRRIRVAEPYQQMWTDTDSVEAFLRQVETYLFLNLETFFKGLPTISAHIARAFTDVWPGNDSPLLLPKSWCDVIQDQVGFDDYQRPVPFIGQMSINPLNEKYIKGNAQRKIEFLDIMERVGTRWNFLGASPYNLKGSTCHPNPAGHELWANYLYAQIAK